MFRHVGKDRTFKHNRQIASLLSFVAGMVNVVGYLSIHRFTTNVTGHFALFVEGAINLNLLDGIAYLLYIVFFLLGSFVSNFLVEIISRRDPKQTYIIPTILESIILIVVAITGNNFKTISPNIIAYCLLFAMGLQNSLVTTISNAIVRTTHLTGLFTDLGIELSQMFFYKRQEQKERLQSITKLRFIIILFFFLGGVTAGVFYIRLEFHVLIISSAILLAGLVYDSIKVRLVKLTQQYKYIRKSDTH